MNLYQTYSFISRPNEYILIRNWHSFNFSVRLYEQVNESEQFCKESTGDWTIEELRSQRSDLTWFNHFGNGVCNIANKGGISACADICQSVTDCAFFSTSNTTSCYACFIYKTCQEPITSDYDYKIYQMTNKGNTCNMYISITFLNYLTFLD